MTSGFCKAPPLTISVALGAGLMSDYAHEWYIGLLLAVCASGDDMNIRAPARISHRSHPHLFTAPVITDFLYN